ncbi:hypothetical protein [Bradyrhizobium neotropicale]|uniref:hypothetical protein n=1 Tax=Bradyrhizobium neotropicale TaxID=1497615 RepID=UPI000A42FD07|nr:hypothetical protein [Bradyrhizobium neotropicale]
MGTKTVLNELVAYVDFSKLSPTPLTTCSTRHSGAPRSGEPGIHFAACDAARWIL